MKQQKNTPAPTSNNTFMLLKCECGAEILILPDAKAMGQAIDAHAMAHGLWEKEPQQAKAKTEYVRDQLIKQLFEKISQPKQTTAHGYKTR
jgi:hypothetical protein